MDSDLESPTVFIVYTHDSEEHRQRVLALADRLRSDGIHSMVDRYVEDETPPEGWPTWSARQIRDADVVLMICTASLYKRVMKEEKLGSGLGATFEGNMLRQKFYDGNSLNPNILPVFLGEVDRADIPDDFRGTTYYRIDIDNLSTGDDYVKLLRKLTGQPATPPPPVHKLRKLPPAARSQYFSQEIQSDGVEEASEREKRQDHDSGARSTAQSLANTNVQQVALAFDDVVQPNDELSDRFIPPPYSAPHDHILLPQTSFFVGRTEQLQWILARLHTSYVVAVSGMAGIGKTALAAATVHELALDNGFPDGIAVVQCQCIEDPTQLLRLILSRFDTFRRLPQTHELGRLMDQAQTLLSGKRAIVVMEGIEPNCTVDRLIGLFRELSIAVLVTSQHTLPSNIVPPQARLVLDSLNSQDALELFVHFARPGQAVDDLSPSDKADAEKIVSTLHRHTLAIELAGAYIADLQLDMRAVARDLEDLQLVLDLPRGETPEVLRAAFTDTFRTLPANAQGLFAACAAFGTAEFGRDAVLAIAREIGFARPENCVNLFVLRALLKPFVNANMPPGTDRQRLTIHPLLLAFGRQIFASKPEEEQRAAHHAIVRYYTAYLTKLFTSTDKSERDTDPDEAAKIELLTLEPDEPNILLALNWLTSGNGDLLESADRAELVTTLCLGMHSFWRHHGDSDVILHHVPKGIAAASTLLATEPDSRELRLNIARLEFTYAMALADSRQFEEAQSFLGSCLSARRQLSDGIGVSAALHALGDIYYWQGYVEKAREQFTESYTILSSMDAPYGRASVLNSLGRLEENRYHLEEAVSYLRESLSLADAGHFEHIRCSCLSLLARALRSLGKPNEAESCLQQCLSITRANGHKVGEVIALHELGQMERKRGHTDKALEYFRIAHTAAVGGHLRRQEGILLNALGNVALEQGQAEEARRHILASLQIAREIGDLRMDGTQLTMLGLIAGAQRQPELAESYLHQGLAIARKVQNPDDEGAALLMLGQIALERNQTVEAKSYLNQSLQALRIARQQEGERIALELLDNVKK